MGFVDLFKRDESRESEIKTLAILENWMAELPLIDFANSAIAINNSLSRLTNSSFEGQAMLDRLVLYYDAIKQLSELAYQRFTDEGSEKLDLRRAECFFIRDMHLNYAQLFYDLIFSKRKANLTQDSILRAAVFSHASYAYAFLRTHQMFVFVPQHFWKNLFQLYVEIDSISKQNKGNIAIKGGFPLGSWPLSGFYVCTILTTTNPNQSESFELEEIFQFICDNANESMFSQSDHPGAQFALSLSRDKGPELKCHYTAKEAPDLYIDISYLYKLLATSKQVLSLAVEKKLTKIWDFRGDRKIERVEEQGVVEILESLSFIHACYAKEKDEPLHESVTPSVDASSGINTEQGAILQYYNEHFDFVQSTTEYDKSNREFMQWQLSNVSQSGACLINPSSDPLHRLSVGELIVLRGVEKNDLLIVAVVRWLSLREGRGVLMGLEYIAKNINAIHVQNETQRKNGFQYKALLAKECLSTWPNNVLITPILSYHAQEKIILIEEDNATKEVMLSECIERTSNAIFFKIEE